jgi:hypothetical protein
MATFLFPKSGQDDQLSGSDVVTIFLKSVKKPYRGFHVCAMDDMTQKISQGKDGYVKTHISAPGSFKILNSSSQENIILNITSRINLQTSILKILILLRYNVVVTTYMVDSIVSRLFIKLLQDFTPVLNADFLRWT